MNNSLKINSSLDLNSMRILRSYLSSLHISGFYLENSPENFSFEIKDKVKDYYCSELDLIYKQNVRGYTTSSNLNVPVRIKFESEFIKILEIVK